MSELGMLYIVIFKIRWATQKVNLSHSCTVYVLVSMKRKKQTKGKYLKMIGWSKVSIFQKYKNHVDRTSLAFVVQSAKNLI